jgi:hypothetical protein
MSGSKGLEQLGTADFQRTINPSAATVDLVATYGKPTRWITVVAGAGTIVYTGTDGVQVTLPAMSAGYNWLVAATAIDTTSTETSAVLAF